MKKLLLYIFIILLISLSFISCKDENSTEPMKMDYSGLFIYPKTVSVYGRSLKDTLEVCYTDTLNVLTTILRDSEGKQISYPESPVFTITGEGIQINNDNRIFPSKISAANGKETAVKIVARSGVYESKPYFVIVLPKISQSISTLHALSKVFTVSKLFQTGRILSIRTVISSNGRTIRGPLNSDNMTIRNLDVTGTLSDTTGSLVSKLSGANIIYQMTGTEKINTTTIYWELK